MLVLCFSCCKSVYSYVHLLDTASAESSEPLKDQQEKTDSTQSASKEGIVV